MICSSVGLFHLLCWILGRSFILESCALYSVLEKMLQLCIWWLPFSIFSLLGSFCYLEHSSNFLIFHAYFTCFVLFLYSLRDSCGFIFDLSNSTPLPPISALLLLISKSFYFQTSFLDHIFCLFVLFCVCNVFSYLTEDSCEFSFPSSFCYVWPFSVCLGLQPSHQRFFLNDLVTDSDLKGKIQNFSGIERISLAYELRCILSIFTLGSSGWASLLSKNLSSISLGLSLGLQKRKLFQSHIPCLADHILRSDKIGISTFRIYTVLIFPISVWYTWIPSQS